MNEGTGALWDRRRLMGANKGRKLAYDCEEWRVEYKWLWSLDMSIMGEVYWGDESMSGAASDGEASRQRLSNRGAI